MILKGQKLRESVKRGLKKKPRSFLSLDEGAKEAIDNLAQGLLAVAAVAGFATMAVVAPNAIQLLSNLPKLKKLFGKTSDDELITRTLYYLKSRGYVELRPRGTDFIVKISQKGRKRILRMKFQGLQIKATEPWDGCWWAVLGDIPTETRYQADRFRMKLKELGFYPLQRTVWFYPYDPRNEVDFVSASFGLDRFVTILRADCLDPDDERKLKHYFKSIKVI
jgi:DNA-binding transcriptional regulator PaaX